MLTDVTRDVSIELFSLLQVLAAIVALTRSLDAPKVALLTPSNRDVIVVFLGKCLDAAKRTSDKKRVLKVRSWVF